MRSLEHMSHIMTVKQLQDFYRHILFPSWSKNLKLCRKRSKLNRCDMLLYLWETQLWIFSPIHMKMWVFAARWQKRDVANKRHSRSGIALFHSLNSRPRPAGVDGRIYLMGGSLVANRGPVEWTCPVKRTLLAKTPLDFVKRVKEGEGIGKHPP